jgi:hypothetical protein
VIPLSVVNGYDLTLESLSTAALADLRALLSSLEDVSPERSKAILFEAFPEVFNPYAAASSAVSASFYEEVRDLVGVKGSFEAATLDSVETDRWGALVGAGTAPRMLEQGAANLMFQFLSGGLTSILTTIAADTIVGNAAIDPAPMGYQRVPKPGCCAFCGMLASRGSSGTTNYSSEDAALRVVGRGVPVEKTRGKRGGQGKGIGPRGSQKLGEKFHDHCKCRAVPVNHGNYVELQADAEKYFNAYADARDKVSGVRKADGYQGFGDQATSQKMILAEMRQSIGVS